MQYAIMLCQQRLKVLYIVFSLLVKYKVLHIMKHLYESVHYCDDCKIVMWLSYDDMQHESPILLSE